MRLWMKLGIVIVVSSAVLFFGGYFWVFYLSGERAEEAFNPENWVNPLEVQGLTDFADLYTDARQIKAETLYVTVLESAAKGGGTAPDFSELVKTSANWSSDEASLASYKVYFENEDRQFLNNNIFFREPNAVLEFKGNSPGNDIQKSFQLNLYDKEGLWHGQKVINLYKDYKDPLRIRRKLSLDYLTLIPDITSFRTRFIRLFIKDLTTGSDSDDAEFTDYGLFTQVEQPNKLYLTNHRLDPNAQLYQAENFNFQRYDDHIKQKNDPAYSKEKFEEVLKIRGNDDHQKLIDMLTAVNDETISIDEIMAKYFDRDNYLAWLAVNILLDNYDAAENFLLYSPVNSTKWYFLPRDFDKTWNLETERASWQKGISNFWDNVLHRRFLSKPENVTELNKKIDQLAALMNPAQTKTFLDSYHDLVLANITKLPDIKYLPVTLENYEREYLALPDTIERNRSYYYELQEYPMPFYLDSPIRQGTALLFTWGSSFDLQGDPVTYDFDLSTDPGFTQITTAVSDLTENKLELDGPAPGIYYWRVTAKDDQGNIQNAYNLYEDEFGSKFFGVSKLIVQP